MKTLKTTVFASLTMLLTTTQAFARPDWSIDFTENSCDSYTEAANMAWRTSGRYLAQCNNEGGRFNWTWRSLPTVDRGIHGTQLCPIYYPVVGTATCQTPPLQLITEQLLPHTGHTVLPGDQIQYYVKLQNVKNTILSNVTGNAVLTSGANLVSISSTQLTWNSVAPGQILRSNSPILASVAADAPCGSSFSMRYYLNTFVGPLEQDQPIQIGKFNGEPVVAAATGVNTALGQQVSIVSLPIDFPAASNDPAPKNVILSFRATVPQSTYVRFTLVSPRNGSQVVVSEGYASGSFAYNQDLSATFANVKALGEWQLKAQVWGTGVLQSYGLTVLPNSYTCAL